MSTQSCSWCGAQTKTVDRTCGGCKGVMKTLGRPIADGDALDRGTWHTRPGGIKVWISWDWVA